jgi:glycosyltransferase involved in cell wall biosynthesis
MNISLIGTYPPPFGGISNHVLRMHQRLCQAHIAHTLYALTTDRKFTKPGIVPVYKMKKWLIKYLFTAKEDIIHCHNIMFGERLLLAFLALRGKKVIITIHGNLFIHVYEKSNWFKKKLFYWALSKMRFIVAVTAEIKDFLVSIGISPLKIKHIPAFIAPSVLDEDSENIPGDVWMFIDTHSPVISANASVLKIYAGQDLYGLDMCIDLCANLKDEYPDIGIVFSLPKINNPEYFDEMKKRIKDKDIEKNFMFSIKPCQSYPIIMKSDIFIRPTNTDGDAVSLREALHFKIPSVASDVFIRPEQTVLFKNRDIEDFTSKVKAVLVDYSSYKIKCNDMHMGDSFDELLMLYQSLGDKE